MQIRNENEFISFLQEKQKMRKEFISWLQENGMSAASAFIFAEALMEDEEKTLDELKSTANLLAGQSYKKQIENEAKSLPSLTESDFA